MKRLLVAAALLPWLAAPPLAAQTCNAPEPSGNCSVTTSASITIGTVVMMTLSSTATPLTAPGVADYDLGYVPNNGPTATVSANKSWALEISALTATWTASGAGARANKPAADLTWSTTSGGTFVGLTTTPASGTVRTGSPTASSATSIFFRTLYAWTADTPGTYSLTVVFTLTSR